MKKRLLFFTVSLLSLWELRSQTTNGLSFDGANDYVACGNILTTSYTKEGWVLINAAAFQNNFISGGSAGQHALWAPASYSNKLSAGHNGAWNQVQDPVSLTLGTWYHIAVTYNAATTTLKLYKNGILTSSNTAVPAYGGGTLLQLGSYDPGGNLMNGSMDEVRIWNYARTGTDILNNMNCELNAPQTGLIAYYRFNQGIAAAANPGLTTLTDLSGSNNNGTLLNFALTGATSNWILGSPVNPLPNVTASATNSFVCLGNQTTLNGGGASTYIWTGSVTNAVAFAPTITATYTVTGTDVNGCKNKAVQTVVVNNLPVVTANVTNSVVCAGNLTTLSGGGALTYTWTGSV
ncbi:MAG: LamG domain-containing protein, partial [Bacteroidetes bacterium]|nr:LamG domain-containing protein [Bacteroidota bacterium]